jgi:hypothetical protein
VPQQLRPPAKKAPLCKRGQKPTRAKACRKQ